MQKLLPYLFILFLVACKSPYQQTVDSHKLNNDSLGLVLNDTVKPFVYPLDSISDILVVLLNDSKANGEKKDLRLLYQLNNNEPLWIKLEQKRKGLMLIDSSIFHGLIPQQYNIEKLKSMFQELESDSVFNLERHAKFDLELTESILKYIGRLQNGKLDPKEYCFSWNYPKKSKIINDSLLVQIIASKRVEDIEAVFQPKHELYAQLTKELRKWYAYKEQKQIRIKYPNFLIRPGDSNQYVLPLKTLLKQKGYLKQDLVSLKFDSEAEMALKEFQRKHGLTPDGLPGKQTYGFLNWTKQNYIDALQVNIERLRWINNELPRNYIWVNIPEYKLRFFLNKHLQMETNIIVGKYKNQTPIFQSAINYLVFNPCWTVPNSIATKNILPRLKKDTNYLEKHNMFVGENGREINSKTIDFSSYSKDNFPYKFYQRMGSGNALGKVKFMFKNSYSIYLHDTPSQRLFTKDYRALSHGCVRVQNAMTLAKTILYDFDQHQQKVSYYLKKGYPEKVYLKKNLPLMIHYFTCGYSKQMQMVQFYNDVYAKDYKVLIDLLK